MSYSDTPPPAGQQNVQHIKTSTVPSEFPLTRSDAYKEGKSASVKESAANQRKAESLPAAEPSTAANNITVNEMETRIKLQSCAAAGSNCRNYAVGGRMQNVNEQGEKSI